MLLARREDRLRALAEEIGGEYEVCDVSDRTAVDEVAARVRERHPQMTLLMNNAGAPARTSFLDGDADRIEQVMRTNYLGGVWCLRAFLPALEAGAPSHVVNIVSVAGTVAVPWSGPYSASKYAQLAFSRAVSATLRKRGVAVHTVNPGFVPAAGEPCRFADPLHPGVCHQLPESDYENNVTQITVTVPDHPGKQGVGPLSKQTNTFIPELIP